MTNKVNGAGCHVERWIAVLGRRDTPTDGVEDYCTFLGQALERHSVRLETARVSWLERGWIRALREIWRDSKAWSESWVLLQQTPMAWSRRGFPFGVVAVAKILRKRGCRIAVIFHEPFRQGGAQWIGWLRGACQEWVVRALYREATKAIFADPLSTVPWLPPNRSKAIFIPIGANIPRRPLDSEVQNSNGRGKTVAVFCLSDLPNRTRELADIRRAMSLVHEKGIKARVLFLGRGTDEAGKEIEQAFGSSQLEAVNLGLQSAEKVSGSLCESDAMLCVRGPLYPRRGSAIAGIACGLPIVGYAGAAEGTLLEEAGIRLVPYRDTEALAMALADLLADDANRIKLRARSLEAYRRNFSWDMIAAAFEKSLRQQDGAAT